MVKAIWNDVVLAESDDCVVVESNNYFPLTAIHKEYFKPSDYQTVCPWKGTAHYYHLEVNGKVNENAAWYYPEPKSAAANIKNYVAFWRGVIVK